MCVIEPDFHIQRVSQ